MKKEQLSEIDLGGVHLFNTPAIEPVVKNMDAFFSGAILRTKQFCLVFSILLLLITVRSIAKANDNLGVMASASPQSQDFTTYWNYVVVDYSRIAFPFRFVTGIRSPLPRTTGFQVQNNIINNGQSFANVTLEIDNYGSPDMDVYLYAQDTSYFINIHPYQTEVAFTIPEGTYDVSICADDNGSYSHHYLVGCGHYDLGYGCVNISGVSLNSSCNTILIDY